MSAAVLEITGLCRRYGSVAAVDGVDLVVLAGERHALVGENGAGKTTLLDLVAGATRPDGGRILFDGYDITDVGAARRARLGIGRTHQRPSVWPTLTALDNVVVAGWPHLRTHRTRAEAALRWLDLVGLGDRPRVLAGALSHGQCRQLEFAMALAGQPRLLLLDEPAAGLSDEEIERVRAILADLPRDVSVLLVEHRRELVHAVADTVTQLREDRKSTRL